MSFGLQGLVVVFLSHEVSEDTCAAYRNLRAASGPALSVRWLLDVAGGDAPTTEFQMETQTYDSRRFAEMGFATFGPKMLPGHCHFPVLDFYLRNPRITSLWVVEYDVRFTGPWSKFFNLMADSDADLLGCHLRTPAQEPGWYWWNTLRDPSDSLPEGIQLLRSFLVIARFSAKALDALIEFHRAGWRGHQEVIVPTLISRAGLRIGDLNDVAKASAGRQVYSSVNDPMGSLEELGTLRARPARSRPGFRRGMLYHPVKPKAHILSAPLLPRIVRCLLIELRVLGLRSRGGPR
jgi:hypothetical protein